MEEIGGAGDGWGEGDAWAQVYGTLREIAGGVLGGDRARQALRPTELVHEAYLRLAGAAAEPTGRLHFIALASRALRQALIDEVRRLDAQMRGGNWGRVSLSDHHIIGSGSPIELLDLDAALKRLAQHDPRAARVVELRFFGGLDYEEIGEVLSITPRTARQDWVHARSWLRRELEGSDSR